jgi:hypothetical protein
MWIKYRVVDKAWMESEGKRLKKKLDDAINSNDKDVELVIFTETEWECVKHQLWQAASYIINHDFNAQMVEGKRVLRMGRYRWCINIFKEEVDHPEPTTITLGSVMFREV